MFTSILALFLLIATPAIITAHGRHGEGGRNGERIEIRANEVEDEEAEVAVASATAATFEIRGQVTAISGNTFTVAGLSVTKDPTMVTRFEQEGTLAVNSMVKVEGVVRSGVLLAEEIKVL